MEIEDDNYEQNVFFDDNSTILEYHNKVLGILFYYGAIMAWVTIFVLSILTASHANLLL